ncbi:MAG: vWA domain-containing protein [Bacillota bacterium]
MRFLAPWAAGFLLLIPTIIIFYLLKQKKQNLLVSSTMLWQQVLADIIAQTPWQKLRRSLLLLLQLLLALLLILALLRPALWSDQAGGSEVYILLDTSASMAAVEEGGQSRLELAKKGIEQLVDTKKRGTLFTLITVGPGPQVLADRTKDRQAVIHGLNGARTGIYTADLESALSLVTALMDKSAQAQVVFFSDGSAVLPELPVPLAGFQYKRVGVRDDNLALGAFSMQSGESTALTRVDNYGTEDKEATIKIYAGDKLLDMQTAAVGAGKSAYQLWNVPQDGTFLEAKLDVDDALAVDNSAWLVLRQAQRVKALLVTSGNVFLEQALKLDRNMVVYKVSPADYPEIKDKYDLYVFDGFWPQRLQGPALLVNPPDASGLVEGPEGQVSKIEPVADNNLLANVFWDDVHIAKSKGLRAGLDPLLKSGDKVLIGAGMLGEFRTSAIAFDLHQSDLPLRPAFPILMQNITTWLLPAGGFRESEVDAGKPVELDLLPGAEQAGIVKPDGGKLVLAMGDKQLDDTSLPGIYQLAQESKGEKKVDYLASNFANPQESKVKPLAQVALRLKDVEQGPGSKVNWELWSWFVLLMLPVLAVEWWVYLRGH